MSTSIEALRERIEALVSAGDDSDANDAREAFGELRAALSRGEARAASPDPDSLTGWTVKRAPSRAGPR